MEKYNYHEALKSDISDKLNEWYTRKQILEQLNENREEFEQKLNSEMWICDAITGNASGSYTFNAWKAEEYLCHNLDLLQEALDEFGYTDINILEKGAEWCDAVIRCYLLGQVLSEVLNEYENE